MGEGGETEKQKNRFVLRIRGCPSQAGHQEGSSDLQRGHRDPSTRGMPTWLLGRPSLACLGQHQTQITVPPGQGQSPGLPPRAALPGTRQGRGLGQRDLNGSLTHPSPGGNPRREARLAQEVPGNPQPGHPAQDRRTQTLTVGDVPKTLGVQQVPQPGHLVLQLSDQFVVGVLIDDGVTADLLSPVRVPGQQRELWAVPVLAGPRVGGQSKGLGLGQSKESPHWKSLGPFPRDLQVGSPCPG